MPDAEQQLPPCEHCGAAHRERHKSFGHVYECRWMPAIDGDGVEYHVENGIACSEHGLAPTVADPETPPS